MHSVAHLTVCMQRAYLVDHTSAFGQHMAGQAGVPRQFVLDVQPQQKCHPQTFLQTNSLDFVYVFDFVKFDKIFKTRES